jgi:DNA-binding CsgD family transcriptional regulator
MITATFGASTWTGFLGKDLAPRELEATLLAAGDLTIKEIARRMDASPRTVEKRLESARFKLGSRTMRGLVTEALRRGLISFSFAASQDPQHQQDQNNHAGVLIA